MIVLHLICLLTIVGMTTSQYTSRFQDESQRTLQSEKERREAISRFSHKLYQSIAASETGNIFLSPLTVLSALDSLSLGAAGETLAELNAASGSSASSRVYWNLFNRLQTKPYINAQKDIYLRDPVPDSIQRSARNNLKTTFNTIDSENIEIITRLTLQVELDKPFTSTGIEPFGQSSIEMMSAIGYFAYADIGWLDARAIELPLSDFRVSILILLPNQWNSNLAALEANLDALDWNNLWMELDSRRLVEVKLPKIETNFSTDLVDSLTQVGITKIFSDDAELSALSETGTAGKVIDFQHSASIAWSETVNSHTNEIELDGETVLFHVNQPFIYYILERGGYLSTERYTIGMGRFNST